MRTVTALRERVEAGVNLLDQKVPGWAERIDVYTLNIASTRCCVLGQLFGDFGLGLFKLYLEPTGSKHFGFEGDIAEMEILTHLWRDVTLNRHAERIVAAMDKASEPVLELV